MVPSRNIVEKASQVLGYTFKDAQLLKESLTHASGAGHRLDSNERMEFLGDAILAYTVCDYLFRHYKEMHEGDMTKIKSTVVSRKVCAKISSKINLNALLQLGKGVSSRPTLPESIGAAVLESVIAAIYLDGGIRPAKRFILKHVVPFIHESAESSHQHNFKSVLQQYAQRHLPVHPTYVKLDEKGPDHSKCFEICVEIDGKRFESAWAASKKEAEQKAALAALCGLNLAQVDSDGQVVLQGALLVKRKSKRPVVKTGKTAKAVGSKTKRGKAKKA